jgi:hypothetical protein
MYVLTTSTGAIVWEAPGYTPAAGEQLLGSAVLYSNNGMSFERMAIEYTPQSGEVFFPDIATPTQLTDTFPGYAAAAAVIAAQPLIAQARAALAASDTVFIRCGKAGVNWPSAWQSYVAALRVIVSSGAGTLPTQPTYPSGT